MASPSRCCCRLEEGQDFLNRALSTYQRTGSPLGIAESLLLQVYIDRVQDRMTDAREAARKALQVATDGGIEEWIIRAQCAMAEVLMTGGLVKEACEYIDLADKRARDAKMEFLLPYALRVRAWALYGEGQIDQAEKLIREAITLFTRFENKFELASAYRDLGRLLIRRDGTLSEQAQEAFSQAIAMFEAMQARREFDRTLAVCQDDTREVAATKE